MMSAGGGNKAPAAGPGREQCPRCASRDTKFCYYNNYNTAQPRHFCRACRRYWTAWTLGGSVRNVPVGGSTRKRPRPARPTRAMAAAMATPTIATTTTASAGGGGSPFAASPATLQGAAGGGLLLSSLLLGSAWASPLLALGAAPLLEGRLGLGEAAALAASGAADWATGDLAHQQQLALGAGALPWPTGTTIY